MTQHAELIERLNDLSNWSESLDCEIMREAAQTLEALEREVEGLRLDAEMWRWAVSPRSDQRLNIIAAYDNWDGQDSFEDAVIAARAAAIQHEGAST